MVQIKTGVPSAPANPRAIAFGDSVESAGKIKQTLGVYAVPAVAVQASTLGELETRLTVILRKYPLIGLVILSLRGFENPAKPIEIVKKCGFPVIVLAPLRKNSNSRPIDFHALGVTGFQWQQSDCLKNVALTARRILKITTPIDENVLPKQEFSSGGIARKPRGESGESFNFGESEDGEPSEEIDFKITQKPMPSSAELIEKETLPKQTHERIEKSLGTKCHNGVPHPAVTALSIPVFIQQSPTAFSKPVTIAQPKEKKIMSTNKLPDIADINTTLLDAIEQLTAAASHHRGALNAIKEIASDVHEATNTLLEKINDTAESIPKKSGERTASKTRHNKKSVSKKSAGSLNQYIRRVKDAFKPRKKREAVELAGKSILFTSGPAQVIKQLLKKPGNIVSKDMLQSGASRGVLDQRLWIIRKELTKAFGANGSDLLVTHPREGWSLDVMPH